MARLIIAGLLLAGAVAAFGVTGTLTYFNDTASENLTVDTATVAIGSTYNFPLSFQKLVPGQWKSQDVAVQNGSDVPADLYVQLLSSGGAPDFCSPTPVLEAAIDDLDTSTRIWGTADPCTLFPGWSGSTIARVGDDVGAGAWKNYRVWVRLIAAAGNAYQGQSRTDTVHLIAVQDDGLAPIPDDDGGTNIPQCDWPNDGVGAPAYCDGDDDPNYP
jgi:predicted ribosomally synthesized peptide with SipW-like signal peptide